MPKLGDIVTFIANNTSDEYNYSKEHPAIITRVFSDHMVNCKVFFDCGPVEDRTSVNYSDGKASYGDLE